MSEPFFIIPRRPARAWWEMEEKGALKCSLCGATANPADLTVCPQCRAKMTIDEAWTKKILERGYRKK